MSADGVVAGALRCSLPSRALSGALQLVSRAVSPRSTLPVLANVLLETRDGRLSVTATNLDLTISADIPAQVAAAGRTTVPARLLTDLVTSFPDEACELVVDPERAVLDVACHVHRSRLHGIDAVEFPPLPPVGDGVALTVAAADLEEGVELTGLAASGDEATPVLTGILVELGEGEVTLVATDRHRLAVKRVPASTEGMEREVPELIVPARHMAEVARAVTPSRPEVTVRMGRGRSHISFELGDVSVSSRLIEGRYPNYRHVIPAPGGTRVVMGRAELLRAVRTAAVLARDVGSPLRLVVEEGRVTVVAQTAEVGEDEAPLEAEVIGEGMRIAFNARYLLDVLGALEEERVELTFNGPVQPSVVRAVGRDDYLCVVMPVRVA